MTTPYNPFTDTHCQICDKILSSIDEPIEVVKACIECGFPLHDALTTLEAQKRMAQSVKAKFFPTRP